MRRIPKTPTRRICILALAKWVLRSGLFKDGRVMHPFLMPWADFSNMTEEDRHAVVVYLRNLTPVRHAIPEPDLGQGPERPSFYAADYAAH